MRFISLVVLLGLPLLGCGQSGAGGPGGMGGAGGVGGFGGAPVDLCAGVDCDDGDPCTTGTCNPESGTCEYSTPIECDDGNDCTEDACVSEDGACTHMPVENDSLCADEAGVCRAGTCMGLFSCTEKGIRDAIAVGGGPHTFDCEEPTRVVTGAEIVIDKDVILNGNGMLTVDGSGLHRVFSVPGSVTAELHDFIVTNGVGGIRNGGDLTLVDCTVSNNHLPPGSEEKGGGIASSGTLTMTDSIVSGNSAEAGAGGIWTSGTLEMTDCTLSGNTSMGTGGGMFVESGAALVVRGRVSGNTAVEGGGVANAMMLTLTEVTFSGNRAADGGGVVNRGTLVAVDSTFSGNSASFSGGAAYNEGGSLSMVGSTLSGNDAFSGGGLFNAGGGESRGTMLTNCTVSENEADDQGGGLFNAPRCVAVPCEAGALGLVSVTVADNMAGGSGTAIAHPGFIPSIVTTDIQGSLIKGRCGGNTAGIVSAGYNIESPDDTCVLSDVTDRAPINPVQLNLLALTDNGGPTETHSFPATSVAVDGIPDTACHVDTDQRGVERPQGLQCDVGAVELVVP